MTTEEENPSPKNPRTQSKIPSPPSSSPRSDNKDGIFSPRFRSAAAMAGWDEEALILASLVVEDTPVRESRHKKRKSPSKTNSNRSRRSKRQTPDSIPRVVFSLDDDEGETKKDVGVEKKELEGVDEKDEKKTKKGEGGTDQKSKGIPCMDRLHEELSCAICLEICFEPSTTPCGHSFCKKCLKCATLKCGKRCPKCRQLISNGRSCTVNTVLWNTIQLLFPDEIEARRKTSASNSRNNEEVQNKTPESNSQEVRINRTRTSTRGTGFISARQYSQDMERDRSSNRRRAGPTQSEDAALARRLQREEFMGVFSDTNQQTRSTTVLSARANLRAMTSDTSQLTRSTTVHSARANLRAMASDTSQQSRSTTVHSARANLRAMASRAFHIRTRGPY